MRNLLLSARASCGQFPTIKINLFFSLQTQITNRKEKLYMSYANIIEVQLKLAILNYTKTANAEKSSKI